MNQKIIFKDVGKQQCIISKVSKKNLIGLPKCVYQQGIILSQSSKQFLLPSFVFIILGAMGSGKTHFITSLISNPLLLGYRFDRILYVGPTKYFQFIHTDQNTSVQLDTKWIFQKIQQAKVWNCLNMLIIFDDVISQFKTKNLKQIQRLFYNRRHLLNSPKDSLKKGNISILVSSQKLTSIPRQIRDTCNIIVSFKINGAQTDQMMKQCLMLKSNFKARFYFQSLKKYQFILLNLEKNMIFNSDLQAI